MWNGGKWEVGPEQVWAIMAATMLLGSLGLAFISRLFAQTSPEPANFITHIVSLLSQEAVQKVA